MRSKNGCSCDSLCWMGGKLVCHGRLPLGGGKTRAASGCWACFAPFDRLEMVQEEQNAPLSLRFKGRSFSPP